MSKPQPNRLPSDFGPDRKNWRDFEPRPEPKNPSVCGNDPVVVFPGLEEPERPVLARQENGGSVHYGEKTYEDILRAMARGVISEEEAERQMNSASPEDQQ